MHIILTMLNIISRCLHIIGLLHISKLISWVTLVCSPLAFPLFFDLSLALSLDLSLDLVELANLDLEG